MIHMTRSNAQNQNKIDIKSVVLSSDRFNFSDNSEFGIGNDWDDLKRRLSSIKKSCGEVCDQTIRGTHTSMPHTLARHTHQPHAHYPAKHFLNCDNNKNLSKKIWYFVFVFQLPSHATTAHCFIEFIRLFPEFSVTMNLRIL